MYARVLREWHRRFGKNGLDDPRTLEFLEAVGRAWRLDEAERAENRDALEAAAVSARQLAREPGRGRDAIFHLCPDLLGMLDEDLSLIEFNEAWTRVLGYSREELTRARLAEWMHPDDRQRARVTGQTLRAGGDINDFEVRFKDSKGRWRLFNWTIRSMPSGVHYCVGRDVTQQRELQRELAQAQKLESIGQLAAGVAHEINTPMQFIGDNVNFADDAFKDLLKWVARARAALASAQLSPADAEALRTLDAEADLDFLLEEVPRALHETRDGVRRVAELARALKEFAHPDLAEVAPADLNKAIDRTLVLARGSLKHVALVKTDFADLPDVVCHVGSLNQVFLNLLVNAAHAIEDRARDAGPAMGRITIATRVDRDDVVVSVTDTGCGIPEGIRDRIFEPFFTTKEVGRGSGQGLPLIRSIVVERHAGVLTFDTEVGVGTTFHVRLPINGPVSTRRVA